jgi:hypothetical protein
MNYKQMLEKLQELEARLHALEAKQRTAPIMPQHDFRLGCSRCGLGSDGRPMGYVCNDPLCPTRISCLNTQDIFK